MFHDQRQRPAPVRSLRSRLLCSCAGLLVSFVGQSVLNIISISMVRAGEAAHGALEKRQFLLTTRLFLALDVLTLLVFLGLLSSRVNAAVGKGFLGQAPRQGLLGPSSSGETTREEQDWI